MIFNEFFKNVVLCALSQQMQLNFLFLTNNFTPMFLDTEEEFYSAEHICYDVSVVKNKINIQFSNSTIFGSYEVLTFRLPDRRANKSFHTDAHTWACILRGITQTYHIKSFSNHPLTLSHSQGRNHCRLSGKVWRNVCLERTQSPCRRTRWALRSDFLTL